MWAGYPNVITLTAHSLDLLLVSPERERLLETALSWRQPQYWLGRCFLTHSLSAGIFVAITAAAVLAILFFPKETRAPPGRTALYWIAYPSSSALVLVAPFLVQASPGYFSSRQRSYLSGSARSPAAIGRRHNYQRKCCPLSNCFTAFRAYPRIR